MTQKFTTPDWVNWLAQDADGAWWGFEQEPLQHDSGWYENEIGRYIKLAAESANPDWRTTLRKIQ
jgi:poly(3-hydroxyalkanoate) synthetase